MFDGYLKVLSDVETVFELTGMLIGVLKQFVDEPYPILPVLLGSVVSVEFFEFGVICCKILLGDCLVEDYFFELVIFDLNPKVVFSLASDALQQFVYLL